MSVFRLTWFGVLVVALGASGAAEAAGPVGTTPLRMNHVQVRGTHNSYHVATPGGLPTRLYTHAPLDVQLDEQGVRQLELDVHWDARAGVFRVYHLPGDVGTTCGDLGKCLGIARRWSDAHPRHHFLMVNIECKDEQPEVVDEGYFARLDEAIRAVWPDERRVSPDDLRRGYATLREAVEDAGWLALEETRGKAMFVLLDGGRKRDIYSRGGTSLAGRAMFVQTSLESPLGVVTHIDQPLGNEAWIAELVRDGVMVRVRADAGLFEPFLGSVSRQMAALASGAQWVVTDFPAPESGAKLGLRYWLAMPGGKPSRCNPVSAPAWCTAEAVESLWVVPVAAVHVRPDKVTPTPRRRDSHAHGQPATRRPRFGRSGVLSAP